MSGMSGERETKAQWDFFNTRARHDAQKNVSVLAGRELGWIQLA